MDPSGWQSLCDDFPKSKNVWWCWGKENTHTVLFFVIVKCFRNKSQGHNNDVQKITINSLSLSFFSLFARLRVDTWWQSEMSQPWPHWHVSYITNLGLCSHSGLELENLRWAVTTSDDVSIKSSKTVFKNRQIILCLYVLKGCLIVKDINNQCKPPVQINVFILFNLIFWMGLNHFSGLIKVEMWNHLRTVRWTSTAWYFGVSFCLYINKYNPDKHLLVIKWPISDLKSHLTRVRQQTLSLCSVHWKSHDVIGVDFFFNRHKCF